MVEVESVVSSKATASRRVGVGIAILAVGALTVFAHVRVAQIGDEYTGGLAALDRVFDLLFVGSLAGLAFCAGRAVSRSLALDFASLAEELSISVLLGTGIIGTLVHLLGLAGWLTPPPVAALLLLIAALARREAARLYEVGGAVWRKAAADKSNRTVALLFLTLVALLTLRAMTPPAAMDELIYHLPVTRSFTQQGRVHPVYDNFSGNMPFLVHMIYAVCLLAKADIAARLFSLLLAVVTALALYGFCARFLNRRVAVAALFGFFGAGMVIEVAVTSRIDVSVAGMCFAAAYAMMAYLETGRRGWLWASAALAGFSVAMKYNAGVWAALIGVMYLAESLRNRRGPLPGIVMRGVVYAAIAVAVASPWFIKNQVWFQNPVYPLLTGEAVAYENGRARYFNEEDERRLAAHYEAACKESPDAHRAIAADMAAFAAQRVERHSFRFWEYFTKPDTYNLGIGEAYQDPNYLFLLAPLALLLGRRRWLVWLAVCCAGFFVVAASTSWIARYLLPVYPALTVLAAWALIELADRLRSRARLAGALPALALAAVIGSPAFINVIQIYASGTVSFLTGALSRRDFLSVAFYYPAIDYVNRRLPPGEKVMMVGAQLCYDLKRDYIAEGGWDSVEWQRALVRNDSLEGVHADLRRRGVTHIIYSPSLFKFVALNGRQGSGPSGSLYREQAAGSNLGVDYAVQLRNWMTFENYRRRFLDTVGEFKDSYVLRLR